MAAAAGVDDVELISANALHRRLTAGRAQATSSASASSARSSRRAPSTTTTPRTRRTSCTSARPTAARTSRSTGGRPSRDLLVYVNVNLVAMDGGHKSVADRAGVVQVAAAPPQQPHDGARRGRSWTTRSRRCTVARGAWARMLADHLEDLHHRDHAQQRRLPAALTFLMKREWEWGVRDQASMLTARRASPWRRKACGTTSIRGSAHRTGSRGQRRRDRGGARADRRARCTSSRSSRCRARATSWCWACRTWGRTT